MLIQLALAGICYALGTTTVQATIIERDAANPSISPSASLPSGAAPPIDPAFAGFAFEARSFWYYAGIDGKPNKFSRNLVQAIANKTKVKPIIRVGGTSLDHSWGYNPEQNHAIVVPKDEEGSGIPSNVKFGPSYFKAFAHFPESRYIFDIPFAYENRSNSLLFADAAYQNIGPENIFALELGNEVNLYPGGNRPKDWSISNYVSQWTQWTSAVDKRLNRSDHAKVWQAAAISAETANSLLPNYKTDSPWEVPTMFEKAGLIKEAPRIKTTSIHYYQTKINRSTTLKHDLMNHAAVTIGSRQIKTAATYLNKRGIPLALGEVGNSLGNGTNGSAIQAVLGSALWQVDFMLYQMSIGVNKINYQSGIVFDFSLWSVNFPSPKQNRTNAVLAPFYGQIFAAEFIGPHKGEIQVSELDIRGVESDFHSAYASYEDKKLAKVAVVNMEYWSGKPGCSSSQSSRPMKSFTISVPKDVKSVQKKVLTSPCGADSYASEGITWAGMSWNTKENDGIGRQTLTDQETVRAVPITNGTVHVSVAASEAIMLNLQY